MPRLIDAASSLDNAFLVCLFAINPAFVTATWVSPLLHQSELPQQIPWNSVESDLGCTSRIYFGNLTLTLHKVMLTSQKNNQHNNKYYCSKTNGYEWILWGFYEKSKNFIYYVDKTFAIIKIMDLNGTGPICYSAILLRQFRLIKLSYFIHSTTPYIHLRLDSQIQRKFSD